MRKSLSIKFWFVLLVNLLFIPTILLLSLFFYNEFKSSLNDRILHQLTSIKRLKRVQIEGYLERQWRDFNESPLVGNENVSISKKELSEILNQKEVHDGVYDITSNDSKGQLKLAFVKSLENGLFQVYFENGNEIQQILLERTGMGESGESYLVGEDFRLRSMSRFFPNKAPFDITCDSKGVLAAFEGKLGRAIVQDYRGVKVYSAYHYITFQNIHWAILSEMDLEEVHEPLEALKKKLLPILILVIIITFLLSILLVGALTRPLLRMKLYLDKLSNGDHEFEIEGRPFGSEMNMMYASLSDMVAKFRATINFSKEIGEMNLLADYQLIGENDTLGRSLLAMREQLKKINALESTKQRELRAAIISGQEKERSRLSKELHDGIGPMLTHLKLLVQNQDLAEEKKTELKSIIDETVSEVRRMTFNLMPQSLLDFGVAKAIKNLVYTLEPLTETKIEFISHSGVFDGNFSPEINIGLFRISQECLNNGLKHAKAANIVLILTEQEDAVNLYYSDDGKGFNFENQSEGSGLKNINSRVEVLGGNVSINSAEEGTTIEVSLPLYHD